MASAQKNYCHTCGTPVHVAEALVAQRQGRKVQETARPARSRTPVTETVAVPTERQLAECSTGQLDALLAAGLAGAGAANPWPNFGR